LLENNEIRALLTTETTIGKKIRDAEMQKSVYADCRRGRREKRYISIRRHGQEGKGNISVTMKSLLR
jgi:threonyl-tRNA synthetase